MNTVHLNELSLHGANPSSEPIELTFQKHALTLEPGTYPNGRVEMDENPTEEMHRLAAEAEKLKELPEMERLPAVLDLLRGNIDYPYPETVEQLQQENAELASWVKGHLLPTSSNNTYSHKLSEVIENGYGACAELSVAYLWLAQHAGLSGILLRNNGGQITNTTRAGTDEPLFKEIPLGNTAPAHAWVEIETKERGWVPVDPSTKYVGDTDDKLQIFNDAGYMAHVYSEGMATVEPSDKLDVAMKILPVSPGSDVLTAQARVELKPAKMRFGQSVRGTYETLPNAATSYAGDAKVTFVESHADTVGNMGLRLVGVSHGQAKQGQNSSSFEEELA